MYSFIGWMNYVEEFTYEGGDEHTNLFSKQNFGIWGRRIIINENPIILIVPIERVKTPWSFAQQDQMEEQWRKIATKTDCRTIDPSEPAQTERA